MPSDRDKASENPYEASRVMGVPVKSRSPSRPFLWMTVTFAEIVILTAIITHPHERAGKTASVVISMPHPEEIQPGCRIELMSLRRALRGSVLGQKTALRDGTAQRSFREGLTLTDMCHCRAVSAHVR